MKRHFFGSPKKLEEPKRLEEQKRLEQRRRMGDRRPKPGPQLFFAPKRRDAMISPRVQLIVDDITDR
jgi:hypothetical protein